jgi:YVTN family beta-propeller protein
MNTNKVAKRASAIFLLSIFGCIHQWTAHGNVFPHDVSEPVAFAQAAKPQDLAVSEDGATLFVAMGATKRIAYVDTSSGQTVDSLLLGRSPSGVAVAGDVLYVTCSSDLNPGGVLYLCDASTKALLRSVSLGNGAHAPRLSRDRRHLYVLNRWDANVSVIDTATLQEIAIIPVLREPTSCDDTPDGRYLFVTNFLPATRSDTDYVAPDVSVVHLATFEKIKDIKLPNGASAVTGVRISADSKYAYVVHNVGSFLMPTNRLIMGWQNLSMMSIIEVATLSLATGVILDDVELGAANPWDIDISPDDETICIVHAGTHEMSVIDQGALRNKIEPSTSGPWRRSESIKDVSRDFTVLLGLRQRVRLDGNGPRKVIMYGDRAYALEYFTETVSVVDLDADDGDVISHFVLTENLSLSDTELGEQYFCDAGKCFQQWQSCTSCHPNARSDGLNWDLGNDGVGNDKNTKSFVYSHLLPPTTATGVRPAPISSTASSAKQPNVENRSSTTEGVFNATLHRIFLISSSTPWERLDQET